MDCLEPSAEALPAQEFGRMGTARLFDARTFGGVRQQFDDRRRDAFRIIGEAQWLRRSAIGDPLGGE